MFVERTENERCAHSTTGFKFQSLHLQDNSEKDDSQIEILHGSSALNFIRGDETLIGSY